ncbi:MAG: Dabb family protein [Clostridia bacterium]|nr:Dabb family protein [Clostridia bacterium]
MLKHILFWQFSDAVNDGNRQEVLEKLSASVKNLEGKIDGLLSCEIGENVVGADCDFVFYATFESLEALQHFQNHPLHVAHKQMAAPFVKNRLAADYFTDSDR